MPFPRLVAACLFNLLLTSLALSQSDKPAPKEKAPEAPEFVKVVDDPKLPRVLLIGDSISMGYTVPVRKRLEGKANVHRPAENCGPTTRGIKQIDTWLGDGKWDVIHFNFGLHDLKYVDDKGMLIETDKGRQQVPIEEYEKNLRILVALLKKTKAKLIWCATTPVPPGAPGRVAGDEVKYNEAAAKVMKEEGVDVNDLHAYAKARPAKNQRAKDVHYTDAGYQQLADEVAKVVEGKLK
jgi:acyl-CoA thioesterase-1